MAEGFIDVHTHIYDKKFEKDLDEVIERAKKANVKKIVVVSENANDCEKIIALQEKWPDYLYAGFGVHPVQGDEADGSGDARSVNEKDYNELFPWIEQHREKLVCIGEVGLDFTPRYCKTDADKESQRNILTKAKVKLISSLMPFYVVVKQVKIADQYNLPLNVHSRSAGRPTINLLKSEGARNVVMHAFDGKPSVALEGVQCGYYFSIPPCILHSDQKQRLVKALPLDNILLETDSPALGPEKMERNEPANIRISLEQICKIKNVTIEEASSIIYQNTLKLFNKLS